MNVDDVYGTLYSPEDGTIDPAGYCAALSKAARQRGAKVSRSLHFGFCCHFISALLFDCMSFTLSRSSTRMLHSDISTSTKVTLRIFFIFHIVLFQIF